MVTGLAWKLSDVDFVIQVQNYNESLRFYLMNHTFWLLKRQPEVYTQVRVIHVVNRVPLINVYHIPTQRYCDITFRSETSVENSKLLAYYFSLDPRIMPLASLIKFWSKVHGTDEVGILRNYVLYILIVFYLQQKDIVPPTILLQENLVNYFDNDWDPRYKEIPYNTSNTESVYQLLGGFFQYYSKLNFSDNVLSPFFGQIYPRSVFGNVSSIPEEFALYKSYLKRPDSTPLDMEADLCIQDMFEQNLNIAASTGSDLVAAFISQAKLATKAFKDLPSDSFLPAILKSDYHDQRNEVDEVRKFEDCANETSYTLTSVNGTCDL